MQVHQLADGHLMVLQKGEKIVKSLSEFCIKANIKTAHITGIGAVSEATVGYYQLPNRRYRFKKFQKVLEIGSLIGNVSLKDGQPWLHLHVVLGDSKLRTYSGHLREAVVSGTCEIYLQPSKTSLQRQTDPETGLDLIV